MASKKNPVLSMLIRRLGLGLLSLLIVSLIIFSAVSLLPGDFATAILGQNATPDAVDAKKIADEVRSANSIGCK